MLTGCRRLAVAIVVVVGALADPTVARAGGGGGGVVCTNPQNPVCDPWVGSPGSPGGNGSGSNDSGSGGSHDPCVYTPADLSEASVAALGGQPSGAGGWYFKTCYPTSDQGVALEGPVWIAGEPPIVSPAVLARQARSRLRLPTVVIRMNPSGDQLVNLPVWLALDPASWKAQSATASVPGLSVTATARPLTVSWSMGDGTFVTCNGPGTAWTSGTDPAKASPDCGHVYRRSSAGAAGGLYTVAVTVTWAVTWAGAGQSGTVPGLTTTGQVEARVQESQAVIN